MTQVNGREFDEFLNDKKYTTVQGNVTHSTYYVDKETGVKIAYIETSSYGAPTLYMIND